MRVNFDTFVGVAIIYAHGWPIFGMNQERARVGNNFGVPLARLSLADESRRMRI